MKVNSNKINNLAKLVLLACVVLGGDSAWAATLWTCDLLDQQAHGKGGALPNADEKLVQSMDDLRAEIVRLKEANSDEHHIRGLELEFELAQYLAYELPRQYPHIRLERINVPVNDESNRQITEIDSIVLVSDQRVYIEVKVGKLNFAQAELQYRLAHQNGAHWVLFCPDLKPEVNVIDLGDRGQSIGTRAISRYEDTVTKLRARLGDSTVEVVYDFSSLRYYLNSLASTQRN